MLPKLLHDEERERYILSAFTAWQQGAGAGKTFKEYLTEMGLLGGQPLPESKKITSEDAIKKAEGILAMVKKKDKAK